MRSIAPLFAAVLLLTGCDFGTLDDLAEEEASQGSSETGDQALAIFRAYGDPSDDAVKKAVANVDGVVERAGSRPVQVKIDPLTQADVRLVGIDRDPSSAQGMLIITELDCSLAQVEKLVVAKNQTTIYPGTYDQYERTYTSDANAFIGHAVPTVTWTTAYTATALSRTYNANLHGGARRVVGGNPLGGDILLARTVLDAPAVFTKGNDASFNADYQIELYYERTPNKVIHYYGLWRDFKAGGLSSQDDLYVNVVLGSLVDYDVRTSKVCKDGNPQPTFQ